LAYRVGLFDEGLLTNEDYEFNTRVRLGGGKIWLDPSIKSIYFARPNLMALARQYWRYGYWKAQMLRRYPQTIRWRQAIPPLFSASLLGLLFLGLFLPIAWNLLLLEIVIYATALLVVGLHTTLVNKSISHLVGLPLAIFTMHISWGTALLWGIIHPIPNHFIKAK
jgi:GT2 family glycosyltransferase